MSNVTLASINAELGALFDKRVSLNPSEQKVLRHLAESFDDYDGFHYSNFKQLTRGTRLPRAQVRLACRSLSRKGLAEFGRGLWTEDGDLAGSGYACTKKGWEYAEVLPTRKRRAA